MSTNLRMNLTPYLYTRITTRLFIVEEISDAIGARAFNSIFLISIIGTEKYLLTWYKAAVHKTIGINRYGIVKQKYMKDKAASQK